MRDNSRVLSLALILAGAFAGNAQAGPFVAGRDINGTGVIIGGAPGDSFSATDPGPPPVTRAGATATTGANVGHVKLGPFSTSGKVTVTNTSEPGVPTQTVSIFAPGRNQVVSTYAVASSSSISLGSDVFSLTGKFTTIDTNVYYNQLSVNYGIETGYFSNLSIQATGSAGSVVFLLGSSPMYSLNLSSAWATQANDASVPIDFPFAGVLLFNGSPSSFSGTFDGFDTFGYDGSTTASGTITFDTAFGEFSGSMTASAQPTLQAIPEQSTWMMLLIGFAGLGAQLRSAEWRRQRSTRSS